MNSVASIVLILLVVIAAIAFIRMMGGIGGPVGPAARPTSRERVVEREVRQPLRRLPPRVASWNGKSSARIPTSSESRPDRGRCTVVELASVVQVRTLHFPWRGGCSSQPRRSKNVAT